VEVEQKEDKHKQRDNKKPVGDRDRNRDNKTMDIKTGVRRD
jgi:hypothetical protein